MFDITESTKNNLPITITAIVISAVILIFGTVFSLYCHTKDYTEVVPLTLNGNYSTDYITWHTITKDTDFRHMNSDIIYIKGHFDKDISYSDHIQLQLKDNDLIVQKNGYEVYSNLGIYRDYSSSFTFSWDQIIECSFKPSDSVSMTISGNNASIAAYRLLNNLYVCDEIDLLQMEFGNHPIQIFLGFILLSFGIAFTLMVLILSLMHHQVPYYYLSCNLILISGSLCSLVDYNYLSLIVSNVRLISFIDFLSQVSLCLFLLMYLRAFAKTFWIKGIINLFFGITSILIILAVIFNFIDSIHVINFFNFLLNIAFVFILVTTLLIIIEHRKIHDPRIKVLLYSVYILAVTVSIEIVHFSITTYYWVFIYQIGLLAFTVLQFSLIMKEANENMKKARKMEFAERELEKSRIQIMMSQIQPHFLYNSLTSIARLCDKDPSLAKHATLEFSKYLRGNLDSIKQDSTIMFEEELKHVKAYLTLEKMRFGDDLNLSYDIEATNFKVPPLAIQPVVENAVKYGIGQKENGGTITIATKERDDHFEIIVSDNGVGFDVNKPHSDDRSHIGIANVRDRISTISNGTIEIKSEIGVGTTATISIPKE